MDARKSLVVGIFVVLAGAWLLVVLVVNEMSGNDPAPAGTDDEPIAEPGQSRRESATVYSSHEVACAALTRRWADVEISESKAMKDRDALAESLLSEDNNNNVTMVGLSTCGEFRVVSVGVSTPSAVVPVTGPRGTPIVVTVAGPFYAF